MQSQFTEGRMEARIKPADGSPNHRMRPKYNGPTPISLIA